MIEPMPQAHAQSFSILNFQRCKDNIKDYISNPKAIFFLVN